MSYYSRLQKAFEGALRLPLNNCSKYVLFSDCHRGTGTSNDNFLKNQPLYTAALQHYFQTGFTYIELGDGDELWENRNLTSIIDAHSEVFQLLSRFYNQNRLYLLFGNHDIVKEKTAYTGRCCSTYPCCCCTNPHLENKLLFPNIKYYEGIILENMTREHSHNSSDPCEYSRGSCNTCIHSQGLSNTCEYFRDSHNACKNSAGLGTARQHTRDIFLTHGHQADLFNSKFWRLSRFLVRYVWKPLERYGVLDPTSAAKNYTRKRKTEEHLHDFAEQKNILLIAGHTHRPLLSEADLYYCNSGSCVHPYSITCLEIEHMQISLVKWIMTAGTDMKLYVAREVLVGPILLG